MLKWSEIFVLQFGVEKTPNQNQWQAKKTETDQRQRHEFSHLAIFQCLPTTISVSYMCSALYTVQCIEIAVGNCVNITWKFNEIPMANIITKWHVMKTSIELQFKIEHSFILISTCSKFYSVRNRKNYFIHGISVTKQFHFTSLWFLFEFLPVIISWKPQPDCTCGFISPSKSFFSQCCLLLLFGVNIFERLMPNRKKNI